MENEVSIYSRDTFFLDDDVSHRFIIRGVRASVSPQPFSRYSISVVPSENCYATISGPLECERWEFGDREYNDTTCFSRLGNSGEGLLGYCPKNQETILSFMKFSPGLGTIQVQLRRDDGKSFGAHVKFVNPSSPMLMYTIHELPHKSATLETSGDIHDLREVNLPCVDFNLPEVGQNTEKMFYFAKCIGIDLLRLDMYWSTHQRYDSPSFVWDRDTWQIWTKLARKYAIKLYICIGIWGKPKWERWQGTPPTEEEKKVLEREYNRELVKKVNEEAGEVVGAYQVHNEPGHIHFGLPQNNFIDLLDAASTYLLPHQKLAVNPAYAGAWWRVDRFGNTVKAGLAGLGAPIGKGLPGWLNECENIASHPKLYIFGVDAYPDFLKLGEVLGRGYIGKPVKMAKEVANMHEGGEAWTIEIPGGYCRTNTKVLKSWYDEAINCGATCLGLYQLVEGEKYVSAANGNSYGLIDSKGRIYAGANSAGAQNYYKLIMEYSGAKYDILTMEDFGARMYSWKNRYGELMSITP